MVPGSGDFSFSDPDRAVGSRDRVFSIPAGVELCAHRAGAFRRRGPRLLTRGDILAFPRIYGT